VTLKCGLEVAQDHSNWYQSKEGKGKGQDSCYSSAFTISEVAADWHEPMVPQRIMWPSIALANGQLDPRCS